MWLSFWFSSIFQGLPPQKGCLQQNAFNDADLCFCRMQEVQPEGHGATRVRLGWRLNNVDLTHFLMGIISCRKFHDILNQAQTTFWKPSVLDYVFFKQSGVNCSKLINIIGIMNPSSKWNHIRNCNQSWSHVADVWERSVCTAHWTDSRNMKGSVCYDPIQ